jgi:hypothetical protein
MGDIMKTIKKWKNSRNCGSMLALAMVIVLVLAIVGAGMITLGLNARLQSIKDVKQISARSAADAGIEHAMRYMIDSWISSNKGSWLATWEDATNWTDPAVPATAIGYSSPEIQLGNDTYGNAKLQYQIYKSTRPKGYQIVSTGTAGGLTRTVHAAAVLKSSYFGVGAKEDIYLAPNVIVDTIPADETVVVQTNDTTNGIITIKPGVTVPGDAVCGPGGDPSTAIFNQGTIEGQKRAAEEKIEFPPVFVPDKFSSIAYGANMTIAEPNAYISGDTKLNGFVIGSGAFKNVTTVYIQGNVDIFVDGLTTLDKNGTKIIVKDGSSLDLYLGGDLYASPKCTISYGGEVITDAGIIEAASSISIKGTAASDGTPLCNDLHFQPNGNFYGTVYAPDASIEMWPNGNLYGAVVGGLSVQVKPGGSYYYIPSLVNNPDLETLYMGIKYGSWWEN